MKVANVVSPSEIQTLAKARKGYTDKLGRRWEWDVGSKKYIYQRKGPKSDITKKAVERDAMQVLRDDKSGRPTKTIAQVNAEKPMSFGKDMFTSKHVGEITGQDVSKHPVGSVVSVSRQHSVVQFAKDSWQKLPHEDAIAQSRRITGKEPTLTIAEKGESEKKTSTSAQQKERINVRDTLHDEHAVKLVGAYPTGMSSQALKSYASSHGLDLPTLREAYENNLVDHQEARKGERKTSGGEPTLAIAEKEDLAIPQPRARRGMSKDPKIRAAANQKKLDLERERLKAKHAPKLVVSPSEPTKDDVVSIPPEHRAKVDAYLVQAQRARASRAVVYQMQSGQAGNRRHLDFVTAGRNARYDTQRAESMLNEIPVEYRVLAKEMSRHPDKVEKE